MPETPAPAPSEEAPGSTVGQFLAHRFRVLLGLRQVHPDDHFFHLGGDSLMDPGHWVIVAELDDRFGTYGTIGLAVLSTGPEWTIRLLLMSCRVMGRNVGTALIAAPARTAAAHGARTVAHFRPTDRNRQTLVTYRSAGFAVVSRSEDRVVLTMPDDRIPVVPRYVRLVTEDTAAVLSGPTQGATR